MLQTDKIQQIDKIQLIGEIHQHDIIPQMLKKRTVIVTKLFL